MTEFFNEKFKSLKGFNSNYALDSISSYTGDVKFYLIIFKNMQIDILCICKRKNEICL